jgi:hypothetical protein
MPKLEEFLRDRSPLDAKQIRRIRELTSDWQLLADLSFADLRSEERRVGKECE